MRPLHAQAEREVVMRLGQRLVECKRLLELLLRRGIVLVAHELDTLVVRADRPLARRALGHRQGIAFHRPHDGAAQQHSDPEQDADPPQFSLHVHGLHAHSRGAF